MYLANFNAKIIYIIQIASMMYQMVLDICLKKNTKQFDMDKLKIIHLKENEYIQIKMESFIKENIIFYQMEKENLNIQMDLNMKEIQCLVRKMDMESKQMVQKNMKANS